MVSHHGGSKNLAAVQENLVALQAVGFTATQIVKLVAHDGGSKNLTAVKLNLGTLQSIGFTAEQVVLLVMVKGRSKNLAALHENVAACIALQFSAEDILALLAHDTGDEILNAVSRCAAALQELKFKPAQVVTLMRTMQPRGIDVLDAMHRNVGLLHTLNLPVERIIKMGTKEGGVQTLMESLTGLQDKVAAAQVLGLWRNKW